MLTQQRSTFNKQELARLVHRHTDGAEQFAAVMAKVTASREMQWVGVDPTHLLDLLHGFSKGRLLIEDGQVRPAAVAIPVSQAIAAFGPPEPVAGGWLGKRASSR